MPLYFFAVIPPEKISAIITAMKLEISDKYETNHALKLFPHITLKAPFLLKDEFIDSLHTAFEELVARQAAIEVVLNGFGSFNKKNPVFFIRPENSDELMHLQKKVVGCLNENFPFILSDNDKNFHPHITLAYRDLKPSKYKMLQAEYREKKFKERFNVTGLYLLKHGRTGWQVIREFKFKL